MNEILEKIFSNPYFPYIIIGIIVFLVILFIIVLIAGKKDQRKQEQNDLEQTKILNTPLDSNFVPNNSIDTSLNIKPAEDVYIEPVNNNFDEVELPKEEFEPENDDVYYAAGLGPTKQEEIIPFDPDPVIEPYIPDNSVQNFHKVADEIDKELSEMEKLGPILPKVAPVEVVTEEVLQKEKETRIGEELTASKMASNSFSSVNLPDSNSNSTAVSSASNFSSNIVEETIDEDEMELPKIHEY